jgi:hypothetical protein
MKSNTRPDFQRQHTQTKENLQTTNVSTATILIYATGAGITAAAGTRLALQWSSIRDLNCSHSDCHTQKGTTSLFLVTTSLSQDWVICAPAAFLGCCSRFSGSISGIEPWFPVTRQELRRPLPSVQFDRAEIWMNCLRHTPQICTVTMIHQKKVFFGWYLINTFLQGKPLQNSTHVLALELLRVSI